MSEQAKFELLQGQPITCPQQRVIEDWIDYNGHLNMAFYNVIFDRGVDHLYDHLGIGEAYAKSGVGSCFTLQAHVSYLQELSLGDTAVVHMRLLDYDVKRIHMFEEMYQNVDGELTYMAATSEQIGLHVDMQTRRSAPFPDEVLDRLALVREAHAALPTPPQVGSQIRIPQPKS